MPRCATLCTDGASDDNEAAVGQAVRESGVPRDELWVTTKVWCDELGYEKTHRAVAACLKRLGLDYVDLLLIHACVLCCCVVARRRRWREHG